MLPTMLSLWGVVTTLQGSRYCNNVPVQCLTMLLRSCYKLFWLTCMPVLLGLARRYVGHLITKS